MIIARFDPMKDHQTFLKAASLASESDKDFRFVCVGDGPPGYRAELRDFAAGLGLENRITWAGERRDLPAIYSALDIATLTSAFGEGFPNTVGEAMACGVPCAVTDVGDSAFLMGEAGISVPISQPEAMAAAWKSLAAESPDQRQARARKSRDRIVSNFSVAAMVTAHADLYQDLLLKSGGSK